MKKAFFLFAILLQFSSFASALSVDWVGTYRFEYGEIDNTYLRPDMGGRKAYLLNHLNLSPKIIAADGVNIVANFEVLGNPNYPNSQVGQQFGAGTNRGSSTNMNGTSSNTASQNQASSNFLVRELYLKVDQEFGEIVVGRAPVQFGLGMTYNAGKGAFDHWGDVHDLVGYRFLIGNLSLTPMVGKPYDYSPSQGKDVTDVMWNVEYNNPETESVFGVFYRTRTSSLASNDAYNQYDTNVSDRYTRQNAMSGWSTNHTNILLARGWEPFKFKMEAGFDSGGIGVADTTGDEIKLGGFGMAFELEFPRPESRWQWSVRTGIASGDDPKTTAYEGYHFDRNYDLAMLMFNHPMGSYDVLTTNAQRNRDLRSTCSTFPCPLIPKEEALDEDTVSNAIYLSPRFTYAINDKWDWRNVLVYAQLQNDSSRVSGNEVSRDLGWEWDTAFIYKPTERIRWLNELGVFVPGGAYREGTRRWEANYTFGVQSKLSVSF